MRGQPQGLPHLRMRLHLRFDRLFSEANYHPRIHSIATIASCRYRFAPVCYYYSTIEVLCQVHKADRFRCVPYASHCYIHGANPVETCSELLYMNTIPRRLYRVKCLLSPRLIPVSVDPPRSLWCGRGWNGVGKPRRYNATITIRWGWCVDLHDFSSALCL